MSFLDLLKRQICLQYLNSEGSFEMEKTKEKTPALQSLLSFQKVLKY